MVVKDEHDRILITHEAASENGDDARQFLQRCKDRGLKVTAAFSDYSQSFTEAIKAVYPHARLQADHFHTVKNIWGHLKKSLLSYRRTIKAHGEAHQDEQVMERAKTLWKLRWSLRKKPANLSLEEKQAIATLEREDAGFVQSFRHLIRQLVNLFDYTHSEAQARIILKQLRQDINTLEDRHLEKILTFFDDHWDQALRYLRKKGMGKHRRGSNSESGMRLLRRLEKNHDGIRSVTTRQYYIQIYQAIKYLSLDIADFLDNTSDIFLAKGVNTHGHELVECELTTHSQEHGHDNCPQYPQADACGGSTTAQVPCHVVQHNPRATGPRQLS
jgi:hypothetical protein